MKINGQDYDSWKTTPADGPGMLNERCPECGHGDAIIDWWDEYKQEYHLQCDDCYCEFTVVPE